MACIGRYLFTLNPSHIQACNIMLNDTTSKCPSTMGFFLQNNETEHSVNLIKTLFKGSRLLLLVAGALLVGGCGSPPVIRSGQALSYQGLQKTGERGMGITPNAAHHGQYVQVLVKPIQITSAVARDTSPEVSLEVDRALQQRLEAELSRHFMLSPRANGSNTLVVRVRVMRIAEAWPVINALATPLLGPVKNGGLSIEVEALDARTGRQEALLLLADDAGFLDILDSYQRAAHAKALAQEFATETATFLAPLGHVRR